MPAKLEDLSKLKPLIFIGFLEACYRTESSQDPTRLICKDNYPSFSLHPPLTFSTDVTISGLIEL